ncbi:hypothetical protein CLF_105584 [Clonorchis sinensis]|uniref:Uncharacterized protein n=1 Tax=Clonorchis sinensis TaxID=79923 RepID=G7YDR5_CLOSI|nr:hypothetical protein CLF_105584 [Clonorchis sinensis]
MTLFKASRPDCAKKTGCCQLFVDDIGHFHYDVFGYALVPEKRLADKEHNSSIVTSTLVPAATVSITGKRECGTYNEAMETKTLQVSLRIPQVVGATSLQNRRYLFALSNLPKNTLQVSLRIPQVVGATSLQNRRYLFALSNLPKNLVSNLSAMAIHKKVSFRVTDAELTNTRFRYFSPGSKQFFLRNTMNNGHERNSEALPTDHAVGRLCTSYSHGIVIADANASVALDIVLGIPMWNTVMNAVMKRFDRHEDGVGIAVTQLNAVLVTAAVRSARLPESQAVNNSLMSCVDIEGSRAASGAETVCGLPLCTGVQWLRPLLMGESDPDASQSYKEQARRKYYDILDFTSKER